MVGERFWRALRENALMLAAVVPFLILAAGTTLHQYVYFEQDRDKIGEAAFLTTKRFEGAQIKYTWRQLEREPGEYDFSNIAHDLAFLTKHHKRLFVQLQDSSFDAATIVTPAYLVTDPQFHGGNERQYSDDGKRPEGWTSRRWDTAVQKRLMLLYEALGKAFDGKIAGINLPETAIGVQAVGKPPPLGFTPERYTDATIENMAALKGAFPHSVVMQYANFMPGKDIDDDGRRFLKSVYVSAAKLHVAMGGPDLLPFRKWQQYNSYSLMREMGSKIVKGIAVQWGNYDDKSPTTHKAMTISELRDYAANNLRVSYIFWCRQEPFYSKQLVPYLRSQVTKQIRFR